MNKNLIISAFALLMLGQSVRCMESESRPQINQRAALQIVLREMINKQPDDLEIISLFINSLMQDFNVYPGTTNADLIRDKRIGQDLYGIAFRNNHLGTMLWLEKNGFRNYNGNTQLLELSKLPLHPEGVRETFAFFLSNGANPNAQDEQGNTSLWYLLHQPYYFSAQGTPLIEMLLKYGARTDIKNESGYTVQDFINGRVTGPQLTDESIQILKDKGFAQRLGLEE